MLRQRSPSRSRSRATSEPASDITIDHHGDVGPRFEATVVDGTGADAPEVLVLRPGATTGMHQDEIVRVQGGRDTHVDFDQGTQPLPLDVDEMLGQVRPGHCWTLSRAARCQTARCTGSPTIATAARTVTLRSSCRVDPQASPPAPNASDTPMSEAAGMVVTEMNTPIKVLERDSATDMTPTTPASNATMKENQLGVSIKLETGRMPSA